ncbi:hypothetical protein TNCV_4615661 [Trichonephila clavipes]|nr:hypothetical protein TNCV_4615661 [Trichonephila clavipes]
MAPFYHHTSCGSGVSLKSKGRIEALTTGSPHTSTIVITAEIESGFVAKDDLVPFRCSSVSSCAAPLHMEASMSGRQGQHTYCVILLTSEDTTCAWMAAIWLYSCISYDMMIFWMTGLSKAS